MNNIIDELQNLNLTKIESQIYLCLLQNDILNGSQIAKILNIPRTSVYSSLDNLFKKGIVLMLSGEPTVYKAQEPKVFLKNIKKNYENSIEILENSLSDFKSFGLEDQFWNIKGYDSFLMQTKNLFSLAQKEIYISTDFDLTPLKNDIDDLTKEKIKVILFSFNKIGIESLDIEYYINPISTNCNTFKRFMMVIDKSKVIICNQNRYGELLGTVTSNPLMISIVCEHIHHDIYLYKLNQKFENDLITDDIKINSGFEKNSTMCN